MICINIDNCITPITVYIKYIMYADDRTSQLHCQFFFKVVYTLGDSNASLEHRY